MKRPRRRIPPDRRLPAFPLSLGPVGGLLLAALLGGCLPGPEDDANEVADSSASVLEAIQARDSIPQGIAPGQPGEEAGLPPSTPVADAAMPGLSETQAGAGEDTLQTPAAPPRSAATTPAGEVAVDSIGARLQRLEAENDSLRAALGVILSSLGSTPTETGIHRNRAGSDSLSSRARGQEEVLDVDRAQVRNWGLRIAISLAFVLLTGILVRSVSWVLERLAERSPKRRLLFKRLVPIFRILTWFLAILFIALIVLRVDTQGLLAAGAAVGVAVGFAAQDILKNVFGGLIVVFDQPFQVGDKISVSGTYGEVVSIGLRSTRIVTPDDNLVSVPNAQIVGGQVANANAGELNCQVVTDLFLPGWVDESKAKDLAFQAAASSKYVFRNKPIVVLVKDEFRETFLTHLKVKAYVMDPRYEFLLMSDVTERARAAFRDAGLIGPMHGARAWVDLDRFREGEEG